MEEDRNMDIKILVATHKKCWMPQDDVYLPIQLGAAYAPEDFGYQRDDEGENISLKRPNYSDVSALYWGWKNLHNEYWGLCHYRRYFSYSYHKNNTHGLKRDILQRKDYEEILKRYDAILPTKFDFGRKTVKAQYDHCHCAGDLREIECIVAEFEPQYMDAFAQVMDSHEMYACNMFVMKKAMADQYCSWLFPLLFELEKRIDLKTRDEYQARVCGYMAERLFNVWLMRQELNIYEANIVLLGQSYFEKSSLRKMAKEAYEETRSFLKL